MSMQARAPTRTRHRLAKQVPTVAVTFVFVVPVIVCCVAESNPSCSLSGGVASRVLTLDCRPRADSALVVDTASGKELCRRELEQDGLRKELLLKFSTGTENSLERGRNRPQYLLCP